MITDIIIIILLIIVVILFCISTYLIYFKRWREFEPEKLITFSEEAVNKLDNVSKTNEEYQKEIIKQNKVLISELNKIISQLNTDITKLSEQVVSFRSLAEERSTEIKRYKEGYDFAKSKSFMLGLIENIKYIDRNLERDEIKNSDLSRFLEASKDKLELLLSAQGVEKYTPEIDRPITEIDGCKAVETINTTDNSKINFIHSVIKDGYKLQLNNNEIKIISDAEVIVYKLEKINE